MQQAVMCAKCGQRVTDKDITWRGYHRVGRSEFTRLFYRCPSCKKNGETLVKASSGGKFSRQP